MKRARRARVVEDVPQIQRKDAVANENDSRPEVDLAAAASLVAALEQDLKKISGDSRDIQRLRDEVEALKNVLRSPAPRQHSVAEGLHGVRNVIERVKDEVVTDGVKGSQYLAEIGRILGM